ncbi:hypothetical protein POVWA2_059700 [Plasmodium ovale wallikeri]|uniref:Uncharacterized protein n=1 Tax=Plasmodium ovale wallikeri TaxID=864142 RepID=A0A1A9A210_PLAOA|nr:hypothetical protein POVWA1_014890 [Plasmodium ovale wallikeri]SBT50197.1 hypothetical protein POVWA2_059700 [Plasmodium ovale wallikeri]
MCEVTTAELDNLNMRKTANTKLSRVYSHDICIRVRVYTYSMNDLHGVERSKNEKKKKEASTCGGMRKMQHRNGANGPMSRWANRQMIK